MQNSSDRDREEFDFLEISMHIRAASYMIVCAVLAPPMPNSLLITIPNMSWSRAARRTAVTRRKEKCL